MSALASALDRYLPSEPIKSPDGDNVLVFQGTKEASLVNTVGRLALQGYGAYQIAELLDKPVEFIQGLYEDPAIKELFKKQIELQGRFALKKIVAGAAADVLVRLHRIVTDPTSKNSDAITAGKELLDRGFGKPVPTGKFGDPGEDGFGEGDIDSQLARLQDQINQKLEERAKNIKMEVKK